MINIGEVVVVFFSAETQRHSTHLDEFDACLSHLMFPS